LNSASSSLAKKGEREGKKGTAGRSRNVIISGLDWFKRKRKKEKGEKKKRR